MATYIISDKIIIALGKGSLEAGVELLKKFAQHTAGVDLVEPKKPQENANGRRS
jgi:hypothetical protein